MIRVVRCEYIMTVPVNIIKRKIGQFSKEIMEKIDSVLLLSLGL